MFYHGWGELARIAATACMVYPCLILFIRISGKRTLAQLNAFDFVITVAFGSTLATIILSKSTAILEGLLALILLVLLQFIVAWSSSRSGFVSRMVKSEPRLLFHKGRFLDGSMRRERVDREEVLQALRSQGVGSLDEVEAVVFETNGKFSVLKQSVPSPKSTLRGLAGS